MARHWVIAGFALSILTFWLSRGQAETPEWENLDVLQINRLAPRASFVPYGSFEAAVKGDVAACKNVESLNGQWKFHWSPDPQSRPVDFYRPDFKTTDWNQIAVPGNWQTQGFGTPLYVNVKYPFKMDPPKVMSEPPKEYTNYKERNPVGSYRRYFTVPKDWKNKEIFLHFARVDSAFYVWINRAEGRVFRGEPHAGRVQRHRLPDRGRQPYRGRSLSIQHRQLSRGPGLLAG